MKENTNVQSEFGLFLVLADAYSQRPGYVLSKSETLGEKIFIFLAVLVLLVCSGIKSLLFRRSGTTFAKSLLYVLATDMLLEKLTVKGRKRN